MRRDVRAHVAFVAVFVLMWELVMRKHWLPETFFGLPSGIAIYLWNGFFARGDLWRELGYTVTGTILSFLIGSGAALLLGLSFSIFPKLERALDPYLMALNAMPRFALAPEPGLCGHCRSP